MKLLLNKRKGIRYVICIGLLGGLIACSPGKKMGDNTGTVNNIEEQKVPNPDGTKKPNVVNDTKPDDRQSTQINYDK